VPYQVKVRKGKSLIRPKKQAFAGSNAESRNGTCVAEIDRAR
jgi:hypothetical protein